MYRKIEWRDGWPWVQSVPWGAWRKAGKDLAIELMQERIRDLEAPTTP